MRNRKDREAIAGDWAAVREDLWAALDALAREAAEAGRAFPDLPATRVGWPDALLLDAAGMRAVLDRAQAIQAARHAAEWRSVARHGRLRWALLTIGTAIAIGSIAGGTAVALAGHDAFGAAILLLGGAVGPFAIAASAAPSSHPLRARGRVAR